MVKEGLLKELDEVTRKVTELTEKVRRLRKTGLTTEEVDAKVPKLTLEDLPLDELSVFVRRLIGEAEVTKLRHERAEKELAEFRVVQRQALEVLVKDGWTKEEAAEVLRQVPVTWECPECEDEDEYGKVRGDDR